MTHEEAVGIGQEALIWLAGDAELARGFLDAGGLAADDLRARAAEPEFLGFVLEFLLASDDTVLAFAAAAGVLPQAVARARAVLAGGELPNWT